MQYTWRVNLVITAYPNGCVYLQGSYRDEHDSTPLGSHLSMDSNVTAAVREAETRLSEVMEELEMRHLSRLVGRVASPEPTEER